MALAAVRSEVVVLLLFIGAPIVFVRYVLSPCSVIQFFVFFLVLLEGGLAALLL